MFSVDEGTGDVEWVGWTDVEPSQEAFLPDPGGKLTVGIRESVEIRGMKPGENPRRLLGTVYMDGKSLSVTAHYFHSGKWRIKYGST